MRRQFLLAGALLGMCFSATAVQAATNLITNASFEQSDTNADGGNPTGWTLTGGLDGVYTDPANAVDGARYLQLYNFGQLQQFASGTVQTGDTINFSAYGRSFGSIGPFDTRLYLDPVGTSITNLENDPSNIVLTLNMGADQSQTMKFYSGSYVVPAAMSGRMIGVYLDTGGVGGAAGFDDFVLTDTPAPEPASLSLFGAGAALLLRRRRVGMA